MFHIWQLLNPRAPDELIPPDNTPNDIANGRLDQISRNANADFFQAQSDQIDATRKELHRTEAVAGLLASDRIALHRTLAFIEKRWKEGATPEQAFQEAERVRGEEFDKVMRDKPLQDRIGSGVKSMSGDRHEGRDVLVDKLPVRKKSSTYSARRSTGPR